MDDFKFFDFNTKDVVDDSLLDEMAKEYGMTKGRLVAHFGLIAVVRGPLENPKHTLAYECDKCGAAIGAQDPDFSKWIVLSVCSDCKEP